MYVYILTRIAKTVNTLDGSEVVMINMINAFAVSAQYFEPVCKKMHWKRILCSNVSRNVK